MNLSSYDGLLVLDKPGGVTSRDAVNRALRWFPRRTRMGHTGTLDPLATGVLVLCFGAATRLAEYVQRMSKTYVTELRLGARSDTDDADGAITTVTTPPPEAEAIAACLSHFVGAIEQKPPAYSAAKVAGRRAYDLARQGQEVSLRSRMVHIYGIDVLQYEYPSIELKVRCGKGTYIRSLARDLGERLGCGALVQTLRRTRVGPFTVDNAATVEMDAAAALARLRPLEEATDELQRIVVTEDEVRRLCQGQALPRESINGKELALFDGANRLVATAKWDAATGMIRPDKVFRRPESL